VARTNDEVARLLAELAILTELDEGSPNAFRVRAYQNAERAVRGLSQDVSTLGASELAAVKGIGKSIAARIREYVDTGRIGKLEELRRAHPPEQVALLQVPGLGPKTVQLLDEALGIRSVPALVTGLEDGSLAQVAGMGARTIENLRAGIDKLGLTSKDRRVPIATALPLAERLVAQLGELDGVVEVAYGGSLRRFREDIGDIDLLVATDEPAPVHAAFLALPGIDRTIGSGDTKTSVVTDDGVQVDLRVVPPGSFGAALLYFTGSKAHNIRLRQRAIERGWTLNEYALAVHAEEGAPGARATLDDRVEVVAAATEADIYAALELDVIPPELREDDGEIELAADHALPELVEVGDLRGDLHDHTDLSGDGRDPLEAMVAAAVARGLDYLAITDHAENLRINGVSREAMLEQRAALRALEQRRGDIRLLHGAELNIGVDGSLDYDDDFLAGFDWLVASGPSPFTRGARGATGRGGAAPRRHEAGRVAGDLREDHPRGLGGGEGRAGPRRRGAQDQRAHGLVSSLTEPARRRAGPLAPCRVAPGARRRRRYPGAVPV